MADELHKTSLEQESTTPPADALVNDEWDDDFFENHEPPVDRDGLAELSDSENLPKYTEHGQLIRDQYAQPKWGFLIYRTVYGDDKKWETFMNIFKEQVMRTLGSPVYDHFEPRVAFDVQDNEAKFSKKSKLQILEHFISWKNSDEAKIGVRQEDLEASVTSWNIIRPKPTIAQQPKYLSFPRCRLFIFVDEEIMNGMIKLGTGAIGRNAPSSYIEVINAQWHPDYYITDNGGYGRGFGPKSTDEKLILNDEGMFMRVMANCLYPSFYQLMVEADGWVQWYINPPGILDKTYSWHE
jgi:hypothetical protein